MNWWRPAPSAPRTPAQQKIQKLLCSSKYQEVHNKAGELAVELAALTIAADVMKWSGLGDNPGKLRVLDYSKMKEIEDIITPVFRGRGVGTDWLWKTKCQIAISKKCQQFRTIAGTYWIKIMNHLQYYTTIMITKISFLIFPCNLHYAVITSNHNHWFTLLFLFSFNHKFLSMMSDWKYAYHTNQNTVHFKTS